MSTAAELKAERNAKSAAAHAFLEAFRNDAGQYDMPAEKVGEYRKRNDEVHDLSKAFEAALESEKEAAVEALKAQPMGRVVPDETPKGITTKRELDTVLRKGFEDNGFANYQIGDAPKRFSIPTDLKTVLTIGTSYAEQPTQVGRAESALFFGDVEPYFPHGVADSATVVGYIQSTDTNNAAFVAEVTAATDSAFVWTPTTDEIEDVQSWIPASRNLLADQPQLQSTVTGMLAKRLQKKVSDSILNGTGSTPIIWGVFARSGVQTQAKGTDPVFDAVHKAITLVRVTGDADPNLIVLHPNDWEGIRLTRTTDGVYILGNPTDAGAMRLWGLPVVASTGMTEGTGGVVDTSYTTIFENGGLTVEVSTEHSSYFTERTIAISLVRRLGAFHYRPASACKVTGI